MFITTTPLILVAVLFIVEMLWWLRKNGKTNPIKDEKKELYVNYHLTRQCNYQCGFCFHTAKTSYVLTIDEAKRGLQLLADYGLMYISDLK